MSTAAVITDNDACSEGSDFMKNELMVSSGDGKNVLLTANGQIYMDYIMQFKQLMMRYESAIKCVSTRLDIMGQEFKANKWHTPVRSVSHRVKSPESIARKLSDKGLQVSVSSIAENLNDVAGVRIICEYIRDVYAVRDFLLSENYLLIKEKDYIKNPKPNGYRSLHLIVDVPVPLSNGVEYTKCEIQLRTTAMDSWAALEHQLRYKGDKKRQSKEIDEELELCSRMLFESDLKMQKIAERMGVFSPKFGTGESAVTLPGD